MQGCYHRKCYQSYTHKQHIERLQRKRKSEDSLKNTSNQPVKSTRSAQQKTTLRKCIICQKDKINKTSGSRYEPLSDLQMLKASNTLKNAATIRYGQRILLEISGKDLVAIEVKYHRSCYQSYTPPKTLERIRLKDNQSRHLSGCDGAFESLSEYVQQKIVNDFDIVSMSSLKEKYIELLAQNSIVNENYLAEKLKNRLIKKFGNALEFWHPSFRVKSEIMHSKELPTGKIIEEHVAESKSDPDLSSDENDETKGAVIAERQSIADIYHTAKLIRSLLLDVEDTLPWPPLPEDIIDSNINLPDPVYNLIAWILTEDNGNDPITSARISVPMKVHMKVQSIAQDLLYCVSNGRVATPKHIALPLNVKSLTGSSQMVTLLNKLGHGISYSKLRELETSMAARQVQRQENGCILPSNINQGIFSIFPFDNNDLLEETLSGHGTTHCTNGIVIQRLQIGCRAYQEQGSDKKKTKKHSFEGAQVQVLHYSSGRRLNPEAINLSEVV